MRGDDAPVARASSSFFLLPLPRGNVTPRATTPLSYGDHDDLSRRLCATGGRTQNTERYHTATHDDRSLEGSAPPGKRTPEAPSLQNTERPTFPHSDHSAYPKGTTRRKGNLGLSDPRRDSVILQVVSTFPALLAGSLFSLKKIRKKRKKAHLPFCLAAS
jgi:hypothetical protein